MAKWTCGRRLIVSQISKRDLKRQAVGELLTFALLGGQNRLQLDLFLARPKALPV
jgi:hypothetical protein